MRKKKRRYIKNMTKIRSISITDEYSEWLDEHPQIALSKICQLAIKQQMEVEDSGSVRELRERLFITTKKIREMNKFIDENGMLDEYLKGDDQNGKLG